MGGTHPTKAGPCDEGSRALTIAWLMINVVVVGLGLEGKEWARGVSEGGGSSGIRVAFNPRIFDTYVACHPNVDLPSQFISRE